MSILEAVGEDPSREGLLGTPSRVSEMYSELFSGIGKDASSEIDAIFDENYTDPVVLNGLRFHSICEHHLLPFFGQADLVYIPNGKIAGISKLVRCLDVLSRRPQVQERLTSQWIDAVLDKLSPSTVAVRLQAEHLCMSIRGVEKPGTLMTTTAFRGDLRNDGIGKVELLRLLAG